MDTCRLYTFGRIDWWVDISTWTPVDYTFGRIDWWVDISTWIPVDSIRLVV